MSTNEKKRPPEEEDFLGYDDEDILVPQYGIAMRIAFGFILVAIPIGSDKFFLQDELNGTLPTCQIMANR